MEGGFPIYVLTQKLQFQKINYLLYLNILNLKSLILSNNFKNVIYEIYC